MPQHRQFKKAMKVNDKAAQRNKAAKTHVKTMVKKVKTASSKEEAQKAFITAVSSIDSTARKGIIKKETAARKKSRLHKLVEAMK